MATDWKTQLEEAYQDEKTNECPPDSKMEFVGDFVFNLTTYHGAMSEILASKMLEVVASILYDHTFEYIGNTDSLGDNYLNYLTMVNMPFLADKLNWGGSIRGAFFDEYRKEPYEIGLTNIIVPPIQIKHFMQQLINWIVE